MTKVITPLILSLFICMCAHLQAQNMPKRYATIELFTNTPCGNCQNQNPGFISLLSGYSGDVHLISFYPGSPYSSCPIYQGNMSENQHHKSRRNNIFTPQVFFNGANPTNSGSVNAARMNQETGAESFLYVKVEESGTATRSVDVQLQTFDTPTATSGRLFVAAVEREYNIPNAPGNWEDEHHNVFRKFITPQEGIAVDLSQNDQLLSYTYTIDSEWNEDEMYALAWVEDASSETVINSGTRFDEPFSSTSNLRKAEKVSVYPNPVVDILTLDTPSDFELESVNIYDTKGRLMLTADGGSAISVASLASGQYVLIADGSNGSLVQSSFTKK